MAIIKKNNAPQSPRRQPPQPHPNPMNEGDFHHSNESHSNPAQHPQHPQHSQQQAAAANVSPPPVPWNSETVESGQAPERRSRDEPVGNDRRRGYRRVEDQMLISQAHEEAQAIKEKAYDDGYRDGIQAVKGDIEILRGIFEQLMLTRQQALESLTDDIAPLSVEIAERIIKTEISCDEDLVNTIVNDTLHKLDRKTRSVMIKVNPDDHPTVKQFINEHPPSHLDAEMLVIQDPIIERGGCTVETDSGLIDASFSTRLEILKTLFGAYHVPEDDENDALLHAYHEAVEPPSDSVSDGLQPTLQPTEPSTVPDQPTSFEPSPFGDEQTKQDSGPVVHRIQEPEFDIEVPEGG
jgi:flagellar assembly protein FliH